MTKAEYAWIAKRAKQTGVYISELMSRAAFDGQIRDEEVALSALIDAAIESTQRAERPLEIPGIRRTGDP